MTSPSCLISPGSPSFLPPFGLSYKPFTVYLPLMILLFFFCLYFWIKCSLHTMRILWSKRILIKQRLMYIYNIKRYIYFSVRKYEFLFLLFSLSPITKYGLEIILRIPHKMLISINIKLFLSWIFCQDNFPRDLTYWTSEIPLLVQVFGNAKRSLWQFQIERNWRKFLNIPRKH